MGRWCALPRLPPQQQGYPPQQGGYPAGQMPPPQPYSPTGGPPPGAANAYGATPLDQAIGDFAMQNEIKPAYIPLLRRLVDYDVVVIYSVVAQRRSFW
jgi:hypothetical protein